jgi:hypothetical protein
MLVYEVGIFKIAVRRGDFKLSNGLVLEGMSHPTFGKGQSGVGAEAGKQLSPLKIW